MSDPARLLRLRGPVTGYPLEPSDEELVVVAPGRPARVVRVEGWAGCVARPLVRAPPPRRSTRCHWADRLDNVPSSWDPIAGQSHGLAVGPHRRISSCRPCWRSASTRCACRCRSRFATEELAVAVLGDPIAADARWRAAIMGEQAILADALRRLGCEVLDGVGNFVTFRPRDAAALADALLRRGLVVRAYDAGISGRLAAGDRSRRGREWRASSPPSIRAPRSVGRRDHLEAASQPRSEAAPISSRTRAASPVRRISASSGRTSSRPPRGPPRADLLDVRAVRVPVVLGQAVDRERLDRRGDPGSSRSGAGRPPPGSRALRRARPRRRLGADPVGLSDQLADRVGRDFRLDRGGCGERPGGATGIERAPRAVRVAELLAEAEVQPAAEDAAEQRGHDHRREVASVGAVEARCADAQLRLDRPRPIDEHDPAPARWRGSKVR